MVPEPTVKTPGGSWMVPATIPDTRVKAAIADSIPAALCSAEPASSNPYRRTSTIGRGANP